MIKIIKILWRKTLESLGLYSVKCRFWIVQNILKEDEKYLMIQAIEDRVNNLERISVNERWADKDNIRIDCADYLKLKTIFSTKDCG